MLLRRSQEKCMMGYGKQAEKGTIFALDMVRLSSGKTNELCIV